MKISFCTTCSDKAGQSLRLGHIQETLIQNFYNNPNEIDLEVEFVVLNYGDKGGLHEWMMTDPLVSEEIKTGRIVYVRSPQPYFRMAPAKNMAHRLASGDVVCNLDADNFTGPGFARALANLFQQDMNIIINPSNSISRAYSTEERGFFGKVALSRKNFYRLGGYSESFKGWGFEDTNLTQRARLLGMRYVRFEDDQYIKIIPHDNMSRAEGVSNSPERARKELAKIERRKNARGFSKNFYAASLRLYGLLGPLVANGGTHFGLGKIDFRGSEKVEEEMLPVRGQYVSLFQSVARVRYMQNLAMGRLQPEIIRLGDLAGGPS